LAACAGELIIETELGEVFIEGSGETGSQISAAEQEAKVKQTEVTFSTASLQGA
jgi:hypothetical protein